MARMARMLAWQQNIKALIEAKENAVPGASEDSAIERPARAGMVDTAQTAQVDDTAEDQDTAPIVQVDLTAEDDDTADKKDTAPIVQIDLTPKTKKKKRKGKSGSARDTAKIRRLDAEGTPAAKAEAERIRRKRLHGGANGRTRRVENKKIGRLIGLRIEQHYMKIAEMNAEAASSSQQ